MAYGKNNEVTFEIVEHLTVLKDRTPAWNLELNIVSWNGLEPKYDIREWNPDHTRCGKGITMDLETLKNLVQYCEEARIWDI